MEAGSVLHDGFGLANERLWMFARELIWKFLYFISTTFLILGVATWLIHDLGNFQWQGPELTPSNPILLAMAFVDLWTNYSSTLAWASIGMLLAIVGLWIVFEAYFRGGAGRFWIYAASRVASISIMLSATVLLVVLTIHEGTQMGILALIILSGLWWIVATIESLVRRDAIHLLAADLLVVLAATGSLLGLDLLLTVAAVATAGLGAMMMFRASSSTQFLAAAVLTAVSLLLWAIVHSYLVVVRYSTIDIMRANVVDL